jgi:hypothetical protein
MQFMLLIYNDPAVLPAIHAGEHAEEMRECLLHADALRREGKLLESRMLAPSQQARSVRIRDGRLTATDGPFTETKEVLGGFNLIEAESMDEAVRIAAEFPWARSGCVEVRPVQDLGAVRDLVFTETSERA